MFIHDARNYQILLLTIFFLLGVITRDWSIRPHLVLVIFITSILTQIMWSVIVKSEQIGLRSAIITSLSLALLLRGEHVLTMVSAGFLGISSKFLLRFQQKHFFNPANFGIIGSLILTPDAWVSPGQWGTDLWYLILFATTGTMILTKVGRRDTSITFLLTYVILILGRNYWLGWGWDVIQHQLSSGSLLLFAFFMITDPRSTPKAHFSRVIWAIFLGITTFTLQTVWFISSAPFWSLFIFSPVTILLDWIWNETEFQWQKTQ